VSYRDVTALGDHLGALPYLPDGAMLSVAVHCDWGGALMATHHDGKNHLAFFSVVFAAVALLAALIAIMLLLTSSQISN
jgi:hypothetical protein